ncbi:hypothetical protein [Dactylosporangium sp. NPDC051484]|uniref:hypothetical protein n=1 Tax=Dactylosporangium sp. NPDC051484 TaxID=3154942 RepID=UPI003450D98F
MPTLSAGGWQRELIGACLALVTGVVMLARRRLPFGATVTAGAATLIGTTLGVCQDPMLATAWCLYALAIERATLAGVEGHARLASADVQGLVRSLRTDDRREALPLSDAEHAFAALRRGHPTLRHHRLDR